MDSQKAGNNTGGLPVTPPPTGGVAEHDIGATALGVTQNTQLSSGTIGVAPGGLPTPSLAPQSNTLVQNAPQTLVVNQAPPITPGGMQVPVENVGVMTPTSQALSPMTVPLESREQLETKAKVLIEDINRTQSQKQSQAPLPVGSGGSGQGTQAVPGFESSSGGAAKKKGSGIAKAGLIVTALVLMVAGGLVGMRLMNMPGSQDERSQADCAICDVPGEWQDYCDGSWINTHYCNNYCWEQESPKQDCGASDQICVSGVGTASCVTPSTGTSCGGTISQGGNNLDFDVTFCEGQLWSATAYICDNGCVSDAPSNLGVCHTDLACGDPTAIAVGIGSGSVPNNDWHHTIDLPSQSRCKLTQMDGAVGVGDPNLVNGYSITDDRNNPDCLPPSITPTLPPGITPTVTPTPTGVPELACTVLGVSNTTPTLGDTINLTCTGTPSSGIDSYEYRYQYNNTIWSNLAAKADNSADLVINNVGQYNVQCRVCRQPVGGGALACTDWQVANN